MRLRLIFTGTSINGGGNDPVGAFEVSGIFSDETNRVLFSVAYRTHIVEYSGLWDGQFIYGHWVLQDENFTETGEFEIWPDREKKDSVSDAMSVGDMLAMPGG